MLFGRLFTLVGDARERRTRDTEEGRLQEFTFTLGIGIRAMDEKVAAAKDFRSSLPPSQMHSSLSLVKMTPRYVDSLQRRTFQVRYAYCTSRYVSRP